MRLRGVRSPKSLEGYRVMPRQSKMLTKILFSGTCLKNYSMIKRLVLLKIGGKTGIIPAVKNANISYYKFEEFYIPDFKMFTHTIKGQQ